MAQGLTSDVERPEHVRLRWTIVVALVLAVTIAHWCTPREHAYLLAIHVSLRKLYILPVVLAAIWFGFRASLLAAGAISVLYAPHVFIQWSGQSAENLNQAGELVTIWLTAAIAGVFVDGEKRALRRLATTYEGTVRALVAALDMREHDTELHSLRVRAYTLRLAEELRVSATQQKTYGLAALLHDIGKIGVPDAVLLKNGRLTEDEWVYIHRHPELGRRILAHVGFLSEARDIVFAHHEKFDGTGYPRSLSGAAIPRGARIFAVADVFDALTSVRPYKDAMTYTEARREIEKGRGEHFDPQVVDAFLRIPPADWTLIREHIERASKSVNPGEAPVTN